MAKKRMTSQKFYPLIQEQIRKWYSNKLNPFNLCPDSLSFWFLVYPYSAIGVFIYDLHNITISWRQQIEPNETSYLNFNILQLNPPFPLTLLVLFTAFGLTLADAAYRVLEAYQMGQETQGDLKEEVTKRGDEAKHQTLVSSLDPYRLTPRMSIFFPVNQYTSIGFLTIDFRHLEFSIAQSLEPKGQIQSIFRFLDFYAPFTIQIAAMSLSMGLFLNGIIYKYGLATREEHTCEVP